MAEEVKTEEKVEDKKEDLKFQEDVTEKLSAYEAELKALKESNLALGSVLQDTNTKVTQGWQPAPKPEEKSFNDLLYEDEGKAKAMLKDEVRDEIRAELKADKAVETQRTTTLSELYRDYPELNEKGHDLTKKALEMYGAMSEEEKANPMSYKVVVRDAAAQLAILPKKARPADPNENFSLGNANQPKQPHKTDKLDPNTQTFGELVGKQYIDMNDKATVERIKSYERDSWARYK